MTDGKEGSNAVVLEDWNPTTTAKDHNRDLNTQIWPIVKPFLDGGSASTAWRAPLYLILAAVTKAFEAKFKGPIPEFRIDLSRIRSVMVVTAIESAMLLGPYEFLTRKIEAKNKGIPPSLYQEVGSVVGSSAIGASVTTPFSIAYSHIRKAESIRPNVVRELYAKTADEGILALWKGGTPCASRLFVGNVAMLGSFYPSLVYLRESVGLRESSSIFGASVVSGLLTATCTYPLVYVEEAMEKMRVDLNGKKPYTRYYAECALKILKTNSNPLYIFRGSLPHFARCTILSMGLWNCYERFKNIKSCT